jgi:hypothetical protein
VRILTTGLPNLNPQEGHSLSKDILEDTTSVYIYISKRAKGGGGWDWINYNALIYKQHLCLLFDIKCEESIFSANKVATFCFAKLLH